MCIRSKCKSFKQRQKEHGENVKKVVKRLKKRNPKKDGLVYTDRNPWIVVGMHNVDYKHARHFEIDLYAFINILDIDKEIMTARVEPLVNMGQISKAIVLMNLSLVVLGDINDLTVGGMINGYSIEGISHIYGMFSDTIVAYEIILTDGHLEGLLMANEIKLIPIKEYMKLTYKPVVGNLKELHKAEPGFEQQCRQGDTHYGQMYTDVGVYYAPGPILRCE
ncbi:hypothetical protein DH2020_046028 [Rehmannia glutinosa]|uniref:FAD linked oxidase N-terminal domain-containing protein n=1 Tax=Rehmannia glutinosa TaxID=99300 RepID=A0ABR0UCS7_REHGL